MNTSVASPPNYILVIKNDLGDKVIYTAKNPFYLTKFDVDKPHVMGQFVTSKDFQIKRTIKDTFEFYIVTRQDYPSYVESIFNENIDDIYEKLNDIYYFKIPSQTLYDGFQRAKQNMEELSKTDKKHVANGLTHIQVYPTTERSMFSGMVTQNIPSFKLTISMIVTEKLADEKSFLLNNPHFEIK